MVIDNAVLQLQQQRLSLRLHQLTHWLPGPV